MPAVYLLTAGIALFAWDMSVNRIVASTLQGLVIIIGALGAFIAGSNTASNMMLSQFRFGAAVGNMVGIHKVVAASATVGMLGREGATLRKTFWPTFYYVRMAGIVALIRGVYPRRQRSPGRALGCWKIGDGPAASRRHPRGCGGGFAPNAAAGVPHGTPLRAQ